MGARPLHVGEFAGVNIYISQEAESLFAVMHSGKRVFMMDSRKESDYVGEPSGSGRRCDVM